jgi:hypothetical protein
VQSNTEEAWQATFNQGRKSGHKFGKGEVEQWQAMKHLYFAMNQDLTCIFKETLTAH